MNKNEQKPGRFYGAIAFFNLIFCLIITYIIIILSGCSNWKVDLTLLLKIVGFANSLFMITWAAIFGSGAIKKWKGLE